jgi:hypothetical protein
MPCPYEIGIGFTQTGKGAACRGPRVLLCKIVLSAR